MDPILRSLAVYAFVVVLFRVSGKRTLAQVTMFDFVLLLIVAEATQQALLGDDLSITNASIVILTLVVVDRSLDTFGALWPPLDRMLNSTAVILIEDGEQHVGRMRRLRVSADDILEQARTSQGLERLDQIKYAVLERNGAISVIPRSS